MADYQVTWKEFNGTDYDNLYTTCVNLTGTTSPTSSTVGIVSQLYMNTTDGSLWKCTAVNNGVYSWSNVGSVTSVNGQTGAVNLTAANVGALPSNTTYVRTVNGQSGTVTNIATLTNVTTKLNRTDNVNTENTSYTTTMARGIQASTTDLTAGSSALTSGTIYLVYE